MHAKVRGSSRLDGGGACPSPRPTLPSGVNSSFRQKRLGPPDFSPPSNSPGSDIAGPRSHRGGWVLGLARLTDKHNPCKRTLGQLAGPSGCRFRNAWGRPVTPQDPFRNGPYPPGYVPAFFFLNRASSPRPFFRAPRENHARSTPPPPRPTPPPGAIFIGRKRVRINLVFDGPAAKWEKIARPSPVKPPPDPRGGPAPRPGSPGGPRAALSRPSGKKIKKKKIRDGQVSRAPSLRGSGNT